MISSFPPNPLSNMPGMQSFSFIPYNYVSVLPPVANKLISSPVMFNAGLTWFTGYSTVEQLSFQEKFTRDDNGGYYDWTITGFAPGDSDTLLDLFEDMREVRFLVLTLDNNRIMRLIGINAPLDFGADYDSGKAPGTDSKGTTFTFSAQSKYKAPRYLV